MSTKKQLRRKSALARLKVQLKSGVKTPKLGETLPLSEKDINRINQEIKILETKIKK